MRPNRQMTLPLTENSSIIRRISLAFMAVLALCLALAGCSSVSEPEPAPPTGEAAVVVEDLPEYDGTLCLEVNNGQPGFTDGEVAQAQDAVEHGQTIERYSTLDDLGRCGTAYAVIDSNTMPTGERGDISAVHPSGWNQKFYDFVDEEALYNRSHLIGWQLAGEDANERNLITGTREMNAAGMLPYESMVADYVNETGGEVLYRVTPWFEGNELVARGVQMEAQSLDDGGAAVSFNVFVYNVEPGVAIDYTDGSSRASSEVPQVKRFVGAIDPDGSISDAPEADPRYDHDAWGSTANVKETGSGGRNDEGSASDAADAQPDASKDAGASDSDESARDTQGTYVLNTNTMKFHYPTCPSVEETEPDNRQNYEGSRQDLINQGFEPCGRCKP